MEVMTLELKNPVNVRVFDVNSNSIMTKFLDMNIMEGEDVSTAAAMFKNIEDLFTKFDLMWDSVTAIGIDNTNSSIGQRNSIASRAMEKNKDIVITECPCHILHNAASKAGAAAFRTVCGLDFEDHCVDLFS